MKGTLLKFREGTPQATIDAVTALDALIQRGNLEAVPVAERFVRGYTAYGARVAGTHEGKKVYEFYGATEGRKRDGSTFRVKGARLNNLAENPRFMFAHQYGMLPIGNILVAKARIETVRSINAPGLVLPVQRLNTQGDHPHLRFADLTMDMYENNDLDMTSLGWAIIKALKLLDDEGYVIGHDYTDSDVLELSAAPIPVDPNAGKVKAASILQRAFATVAQTEADREIMVRGFMAKRDALDVALIQSFIPVITIADDASSSTAERAERIWDDAGVVARTADGGSSIAAAAAVLDAAEVDAFMAEMGRSTDDDRAHVPDQVAEHLYGTDDELEAVFGTRAYDITREQFEPHSEELRIASRFLDVEVRDLLTDGMWVRSSQAKAWMLALDEALAREYDQHDVRRFDYGGKELPPVYRVVELNSKRRASFLTNGTRFLQARALGEADKGKAWVRVVLRVEYYGYGLDVTVFARQEDRPRVTEFLDGVTERAKQHKLLKGEAFNISGGFLARGETTLEDVFIEPKNEAIVRQLVKLVNERGANAKSRGAVYKGPPGTGKTLTARALKDVCREATYILVSARDFYRMWSHDIVMSAYDSARENAPSFVVFEDCESYLGRDVLELIKQELDGMAQQTGVYTIFTTNFPERFPEALLDRPGRIHDVVDFGLPDAVQRGRMIEKWLPELDADGRTAAVEGTEGYSGAHIYHLADYVRTIAEDEQCEARTALDKALTKLAEQREMIDALCLRGEVERPTPALEAAYTALRDVAKTRPQPKTRQKNEPGRPGTIVGRTVSDGGEQPAADGVTRVVIDGQPVDLQPGAMSRALQETVVRMALAGEFGPEVKHRVGKVLSAATRTVIQAALDAGEAHMEALRGALAAGEQGLSTLRDLLALADAKADATPAADDPPAAPGAETATAAEGFDAEAMAAMDKILRVSGAPPAGEEAATATDDFELAPEAAAEILRGLDRIDRSGARQQ